MEIGRTALAVAAAVCVTAGAGGVYLATRGDRPASTAPAPGVALEATEQDVEPTAPAAADAADPATPRTPGVQPAPRVERRTAARPAAARAAAPRRPQPAAGAVEAPPSAPVATHRVVDPVSAAPTAPEAAQPPRAAEPPAPEFVDLVIPADSVVGLQLETSLTSERAKVEDQVVARVTRDVRVGERVAIPAGAQAYGEVTLVERGGRLRDRARLAVRFTSIVLADGTRVPIETDAISREGDGPGGESATKIGGGAIGGTIIGGILGGARGAAIGGSIGAGTGTAAVLAGGRNPATLPTGTPVTVRLLEPATVTSKSRQ
ncbi:MAG: TrbI/VirB10 family protein [Acidobacteria bacterium]|nr:TrbI/VirB10 family protein [Acidobacteriota bacterium]